MERGQRLGLASTRTPERPGPRSPVYEHDSRVLLVAGAGTIVWHGPVASLLDGSGFGGSPRSQKAG